MFCEISRTCYGKPIGRFGGGTVVAFTTSQLLIKIFSRTYNPLWVNWVLISWQGVNHCSVFNDNMEFHCAGRLESL